jgi:tetratricopeptide (TPR) repeat protein
MKKHLLLSLIALTLMVITIGCNKKYIYTQDELEETIMDKLHLEKAEAQSLIPFTTTDKIVEISRNVAKFASTAKAQANAILMKIIGDDSLNVVYEHDSNLTAYEVIIKRSANCISYTNLFVAIARALGLEAVFVDVTQQIEFGSDQYFNYQEGHICAGIREGERLLLFDFVYNSKNYKKFRIIDDLEAIANFMTILGAGNDRSYLATGNKEFKDRALYYQTAALTISPRFTRAMNNLAVIYLREGKLVPAENLLMQALRIDDSLNVARFNLAEIYIRKGELRVAKDLLLENLDFAMGDPYTYHRLVYFTQKNLEEAEKLFRKAISMKKDYLEPRLALISLLVVTERFEDAQDIIDDSDEIFPANDKINIYRELILKKNDAEIPIGNFN